MIEVDCISGCMRDPEFELFVRGEGMESGADCVVPCKSRDSPVVELSILCKRLQDCCVGLGKGVSMGVLTASFCLEKSGLN
jgi:hypothetical protein